MAYALGNLTGWVTTRDRPQTVPTPLLPPPYPGQAVAWTGHARLSADVAAPLLVFFVVVGPAMATNLSSGTPSAL
ncbi:MAG: hypothetical protein EA387_00855 [Nitriliruptor sp.]|nr:MAG: hypothetical protein EA387_00855 [Nitriliruptor sp.]